MCTKVIFPNSFPIFLRLIFFMKLGSKAFVSCFMGEGLSIFHRTELSMSYWFSCLQLSKFFLLCSNPNSHLRCLTWKPASCQIFLRHAYIFVNTSDHRAEYDAFFRRHALRHWILWTYKKSKHIYRSKRSAMLSFWVLLLVFPGEQLSSWLSSELPP